MLSKAIYVSEQVCIGWCRTGAYYTAKLTFFHDFPIQVWGAYYSSVRIIFELLKIGSWIETRQNSVHTAFRDWTKLQETKHDQFQNVLSATVLTYRQFSLPRRHRQDKTVLSCPCPRCELSVGIIFQTELLITHL